MKNLTLISFLVVLMVVPVLAHPAGSPDYLPDLSTWPAGSSRTTHQYWTFSADHIAQDISGCNAIPEEVINPFPQGVIAVINAVDNLTWTGNDQDGTFYGDEITVALKIDNYEDGAYKLMWFDIGASAFPVNFAFLALDGGPTAFEYELLQGQGDAEFGLRIAPNPRYEEVHFTIPGMTGAWLGYVHVDTICVPEPATIVLLWFGAAMLRWRK